MLVNSSDLKNPPTSSTASTTAWGVPAVNNATAARNKLLTIALVTSTRLKPNRRRIGAAVVFMTTAPTADAKVSSPDCIGFNPKLSCNISGKQEGERADANAIEEPADHAGKEGIDLEQAEIK